MTPGRTYRTRSSVVVALWFSAVVLAHAGVGTVAFAQGWLPDRQHQQGQGLRAGNLEIHPGIALRAGLDTNVFRSDSTNGTGQLDQVVSPILKVSPHIFISTLGSQRRDGAGDGSAAPEGVLGFKAGGSTSYLYYTDADARDNLAGGSAPLESDLAATLRLFPSSPTNLALDGNYQRTVRPFGERLGGESSYGRNLVTGAVKLSFGSSGGILRGEVGYRPRLEFYDSSGPFGALDNTTHGIRGMTTWRFLPSTALLYDFSLDQTGYGGTESGAGLLLSENTRLTSRVGLNGAITSSFWVTALFGHTAGFYEAEALDDFDDIVADVQFRWGFGPGKSLSFGYRRAAHHSHMGGWNRENRGSTDLTVLLGGAVSLHLEASAAWIKFGSIFDGNGDLVGTSQGRDDIRYDGRANLEYRVADWLALLLDLSAEIDDTDFQFCVDDPEQDGDSGCLNPDFQDSAGYVDFEVFAGARAFY